MSYISEIQDTIPRVMNCFWKDLFAEESEPCSTELEQSRIEETHATKSKIPTTPVYYSKETILVGEMKWNDILACESFKGDSLTGEISKLVMIGTSL